MKTAYFIIDGLDSTHRAKDFARALRTVKSITSVEVNTNAAMIKVEYEGKKPTEYVNMAAKTVKLVMRLEVKKRHTHGAFD